MRDIFFDHKEILAIVLIILLCCIFAVMVTVGINQSKWAYPYNPKSNISEAAVIEATVEEKVCHGTTHAMSICYLILDNDMTVNIKPKDMRRYTVGETYLFQLTKS